MACTMLTTEQNHLLTDKRWNRALRSQDEIRTQGFTISRLWFFLKTKLCIVQFMSYFPYKASKHRFHCSSLKSSNSHGG